MTALHRVDDATNVANGLRLRVVLELREKGILDSNGFLVESKLVGDPVIIGKDLTHYKNLDIVNQITGNKPEE